MAELAVGTLKHTRHAPGRREWLRPLLFWTLVVSGVGAALTAGASARDIAWSQAELARIVTADAADAQEHAQALAALEAELAAVTAEVARDRARLAALADASTHLRVDRQAGTLALVESGHILRIAPLTGGHGYDAPGQRALDAAALAGLPVAEADRAALEASLVEGMVLHVY